MAETFTTKVAIEKSNVDPDVTITLDASGGNAFIGGHGVDGDLVCFPNNGDNKTLAQATIHLDGGSGSARFKTILLDGKTGDITVGGNGQGGNIVVQNENHKPTILIDGNSGKAQLGGNRADGYIELKDVNGEIKMRLFGSHGHAWLGGNGKGGLLTLFPSTMANITNTEKATVFLDGDGGNIFAGGQGTDGDLVLRSSSGQDRIRLDAGGGNLWVGGNGAGGDIVLFASGGNNQTLSQATIHLNGDSGDIILKNADCAEEFDVLGEIEPGTVMVINPEGKLQESTEEYDKKVAGVISGAGDYKPGIVLDRQQSQNTRMPLALMGKVYCKVDAQYSPIEVGDLLTTSPTPGHAMKAADPLKAFGTVIGKALRPLKEGTGLIPILIALQ
ncbi:MAG TPA: hypothetical protein V6D26_18690 [Stenomitos sp.]